MRYARDSGSSRQSCPTRYILSAEVPMTGNIRFSDRTRLFRNFQGAFSDCAVLFPLLVLLGATGEFDPAVLLGSTGAAYVLAGYLFGIPMPVQPLKSLTIAALAIGAHAAEILAGAAALGVVCLVLALLRLDQWAERVPPRVVHQIQVGLGVMLMLQAWKTLGGSVALQDFRGALVAALVLVMLLFPEWKGITVL